MADRIRILICEDSDDDAVLIVTYLRRRGLQVEYERAETASQVADVLRNRPPDLVLSDYDIPGFGAEDALRLLHDSGLDVPFILLSGQIGEESAVTLMRAGAHDFVLKGRMARLVPAVRRELEQAQARRDQREAEAALRVSEERFRLLTEHVPDALFRFRIHPTAEVEYFSPAAFGILGRTPAELCGDPETVFSLVVPEDRALLAAAWHSPTPGPLVVRWHRPDGTRVWTEQRAVPLRDEDGRIVAVEGMLRDITDRIEADDQREQLQQQLRQVERLESLGRLAGGIAHDFNNLLAVILGHTDLALAELPADSPNRGNLNLVRQLAERGAGLTRQLLLFSRQEPLRPETVDVNAVVALTERVLRGAIGEDVRFGTDLAPDLRPVRIDRSELERLLLNLVVNSRRAMPQGGRLTIRTANAEGPDGQWLVRLSVADTGVGMSAAVAKHAFEPFFTTDIGAGTGLGLSTAYGVVTAVGGEISLTSEPGVGTTVRIDLPAVSRALPLLSPPETAPPRGTGQTVLVVEDDQNVRDLVTLMLRQSGYQVVAAASPGEAMVLVDSADLDVDVLLTDVVMPGMSGTALAEQVRTRLPGLPVLLMSGYAAGTLPDHSALRADFSLIRKPFTTAALLRSIEEARRPAS